MIATLMNPSLFFQFPCYSFLELSLLLHDFYFSLSVFFYFFLNPSAAIWKMEEPDLHCFLRKAGCQCNDLRLLRWALCMFFFSKYFSIFTTPPSPMYSYHLCQEKKPIGSVVCFQKAPVLEMAMLLEVPK